MILTNSRSAIVAAIVGIIFLFPKNFPQKIIKYTFIIGLALGLFFIFRQSLDTLSQKTFSGSRFEYWQQALIGFRRSPFFGNGPATFGIINQQLSVTTGTSSNYAHNSVLEFLYGNGLVFTIIFFICILSGLITQFKNDRLLFSLGLASLINSLLDPSWSSPGILTISLIFIFYGNHHLFNLEKNSKIFLTTLSLLVLIFFISKTSSDLLFLNGSYDLSLKLDPFNLNSLVKKLDINDLTSVLKIYPNEALIYQNLIDRYPLPQSEPYYYHLFKLDPYTNLQNYLKLGYFYLETNNSKLDILTKNILKHYSTHANLSLSIYLNRVALRLNSPYYYQQSIALSPKWAPFYIDYANYLWHKNQKNEATNILYDCQQIRDPAVECSYYLRTNQFAKYPAGTYPIPSPGLYDSPRIQ